MSYNISHSVLLNIRDYNFLGKSWVEQFRTEYTKPLVLCNSFGKSGTHLVYQILQKISEYSAWNDIVAMQSLSGVVNTKNHIEWKLASAPGGSIVRSHLAHRAEILGLLSRRKYKKLFIYRDLRDIALSHANWSLKEPRYYLHETYNSQLKNSDDRLMASICGLPMGFQFGTNASLPSIGQHFSMYKGWLQDPDTLGIRFEDIVGSRGGGQDELRWVTIRKILSHLACDMSDSQMRVLFAPDNFDPSKSHTFQKGLKGKIGGWREHFKDEHVEAFKLIAGSDLIELGYEDNNSW